MCFVINLMLLDVLTIRGYFTTKFRVFTRNFFLTTYEEMCKFVFSQYFNLALWFIWAIDFHLGTDLRMLSSDILILTGFFAVGTAVLTTWTLVLKVFLEVFMKNFCRFCLDSNRGILSFSKDRLTFLRARKLSVVTGFEVLFN